MRRLMLLRHAKSDWSAAGQRDSDRPLNPRGREAALLMGKYLARHHLIPDLVLVSTARRAAETWDSVAKALRDVKARTEARLYENPAARIVDVLREMPAEAHSALLIGHNPAMEELADMLIATGATEERERLGEKFPTAALAVIDFPIDSWTELHARSGRLDRFVAPRALESAPD
jgi:phosphohistidine phosphatase